jgi:hypothetical protein
VFSVVRDSGAVVRPHGYVVAGLRALLIVFLHRRTDDAVIIEPLQCEAPASNGQAAAGEAIR